VNGTNVATLNFADYYEFMLDESSYIETSNPVLLAQFSNGNDWDSGIPDNGDPFMMLIPPHEQFMSDYVFSTPAEGFPTNYVAVTAHDIVIPSLSLDGIPVNPGDFEQVPGTTFLEAALPIGVSVHSVASNTASDFGIYSYGFWNCDSYGYSGGLSLGTIQSGAGPQISRTSSTIALSGQSQPAGGDLDLTFRITDPELPHTQSAWIYYRIAGNGPYACIAMEEEYGDIWRGTIPGGDVSEPGVHYYAAASDGQVTTWNPSVTLAGNPYSIPVFPNEPPFIDHTPVTSTEPGSTVEITAWVDDNTQHLETVDLCYRVAGGNPVFTRVPMQLQSGHTYRALVPSSAIIAGVGVEYYVEATDDYGVSSFDGQPDAPHFIAVYAFDTPDTPYLQFYLTEEAGHVVTTMTLHARWTPTKGAEERGEISTIRRPVRPTRDGRMYAVTFDEADLRDMMDIPIGWNDIYRFELENSSGDCVGHMSFSYRHEDFTSDESDGRGRDVFIFLHNDLPEGRLQKYDDAKPGTWDYYETGEYQMSMLIPPNGRFDRIGFGNEPVLFVHGVNGSAPYWWATEKYAWNNSITEQLDYDGFDAWEFYYPYDQQITESGRLLGRASDWLLHGSVLGQMHYQTHAVSLVAHSMGGLVSRSYLQSDAYDGDVNKLLMFATPNHGSLGAWRIYYGHLADEVFPVFGQRNSDDQGPAFSDMSPASPFLWNLNAAEPRPLLASSTTRDEYLVVAGTRTTFIPSLMHRELNGQDDNVVAVSSASLIEYGIPLCTKHNDHSSIHRSQDALELARRFLSPTFRHDSPGFLSRVDSYWTAWNENIDTGSLPSGVDLDRGMFWFTIDGIAESNLMTHYDVVRDGDGLRVEENSWETPNDYSGSGILRHCDSRRYYSMHEARLREIGVDLPPADYQLVLGRIDHTWWGYPVFMPYCEFLQPLPFRDRQTTMAALNVDDNMLVIANANSQYPMNGNHVVILAGSTRGRLVEITASVDSSVSSASFYTKYDDSDIDNYQCHIVLETPSGALVDSVSASGNPDVGYAKNREFGYEYISVTDPEPGEWTLQIHVVNTGSGTVRAYPTAYFDSAISGCISFPDSVGFSGENINLIVDVSLPPSAAVDEVSATLWHAPSDDDVLEYVSELDLTNSERMVSGDTRGTRDETLEGSFVGNSAGFYHVRCLIEGQMNGTDFTRILAGGVTIPVLGPPNASTLDNDSIYFFPNPFNPDSGRGTLRYRLADDGEVSIRIYDISGTLVKTLVQDERRDGGAELAEQWDGTNDDGITVANGVYLYVIESSSGEKGVGKIAVLR